MNKDDIWYTVNENGGKYLVIIGCILGVISVLAVFYFAQSEIQEVFLTIGLFISVIGIALSSRRKHCVANKMTKDKGLKKYLS